MSYFFIYLRKKSNCGQQSVLSASLVFRNGLILIKVQDELDHLACILSRRMLTLSIIQVYLSPLLLSDWHHVEPKQAIIMCRTLLMCFDIMELHLRNSSTSCSLLKIFHVLFVMETRLLKGVTIMIFDG